MKIFNAHKMKTNEVHWYDAKCFALSQNEKVYNHPLAANEM